MKKIYIAGKISGLDNWQYKFNIAESKLQGDYAVYNPVKLAQMVDIIFEKHNIKPRYDDYLMHGLNKLAECDAVYFLNNWHESVGAALEFQLAKALNKELIFE